MVADSAFRNSVVISVIVHAVIIFNVNPFKIFPNVPSTKPPAPKEIEVTYYKIGNVLPKAIVGPRKKIAGAMKKITGTKDKIVKPALARKQEASPEKRIKTVKAIHKPLAPATEKQQLSRVDLQQEKWQIYYNTKDLSSEPSYLKYHDIVRGKIKKTANANKPYIFRVGEINLIFTILNSGDVKEVALADRSSSSDSVLRRCALDSVYAASPFPPFNNEMKEDHLTLQVTIAFQE